MNHSYPHIHQIFYKNNKFDDPTTISLLEPYCLHDSMLVDVVVHEPIFIREKEKEKEKEIKNIKEREWFLPKQNDTIFWCIYAFIHGQGEYNQIGHSYGNRQLEEKQKIIDYVKKNPKILKSSNLKITNGNIQEILSEFMVDKSTSFYGVAALAIYYKTPIYFINQEKKTYLKFLPESEYLENPICYLYLHKTDRGFPKYKMNVLDEQKENTELNSMICLESHLKPLKPISYYKSEDLNIIAEKIGFFRKEKMKKQELYEKLYELCGWTL